MSTIAIYEQKYVCFLDILGFSSAILHPDHPHFNRCTGYFFEALKLLKKWHKNQISKKIPSKGDRFLRRLEISQFSDCVAFSCALDPYSLSLFFDRAAQLQRELLKGGLLSRGAITKGEIFHKNDYIFGPALVQAVEMEEKASFPMIILSVDVLQDLHADPARNNYSQKIQCDLDNNYYVRYIENWEYIRNAIEFAQLKETILFGLRDPNVEEKYKWLASKFNARLDDQHIPGITKIALPSP